jgi:acetyl coenzyme A synthetase (ADP forming)-like protein
MRTIEYFFRPASIAVIGASHDQNTIGGRLFRNIIESRYPGSVYPVNRKGGLVQSVVSYTSVLDCPGSVDLALIVVPAAACTEVVQECGKKGVKGAIVISSGFSESGPKGAALQQELTAVCKQHGIRLMGPNCMGIVKAGSDFYLNAQFSPFKPLPGRIAFLSQSGALGAAVIEHANKLGLGMSTFVSIGNEADVSVNDLMEHWKDDDNIGLILLYLESLGDPRRFLGIARSVSRTKPILVVKSGRSATGLRAAQSHTGALVEGSDAIIDTLFKQAGVMRADTLEEMLDAAALFASQPVPRGNRVGIITNAGGAGILAADACEELGLKVPEYSKRTRAALRSFLHPEAAVKNPADMTAAANVSISTRAIRTIAKDPVVDALVVLFGPPIDITPEGISGEILSIARETSEKTPILVTFMGTSGVSGLLSDNGVQVPSYPFPGMAIRALSFAVAYNSWLSKPTGKVRVFSDMRRSEAIRLIGNAQGNGRTWLQPDEVNLLLDCYGIHPIKTVKVTTPREAGRVASEFGRTVVLKGIGSKLIHKSEVGAVRFGLAGESEVRAAAEEMADRLASAGHELTGFLVQPMVAAGPEMIVGATKEPAFGHVVACGTGGILVELIKDLSIRIAPISTDDASEMVHSLKGYALLSGYRGGPKYDIKFLEEMILRVAALVQDQPEVMELDLNPVILRTAGHGASVVDARIRLQDS